jgi:hypothetical protein
VWLSRQNHLSKDPKLVHVQPLEATTYNINPSFWYQDHDIYDPHGVAKSFEWSPNPHQEYCVTLNMIQQCRLFLVSSVAVCSKLALKQSDDYSMLGSILGP